MLRSAGWDIVRSVCSLAIKAEDTGGGHRRHLLWVHLATAPVLHVHLQALHMRAYHVPIAPGILKRLRGAGADALHTGIALVWQAGEATRQVA